MNKLLQFMFHFLKVCQARRFWQLPVSKNPWDWYKSVLPGHPTDYFPHVLSNLHRPLNICFFFSSQPQKKPEWMKLHERSLRTRWSLPPLIRLYPGIPAMCWEAVLPFCLFFHQPHTSLTQYYLQTKPNNAGTKLSLTTWCIKFIKSLYIEIPS